MKNGMCPAIFQQGCIKGCIPNLDFEYSVPRFLSMIHCD